MALQRNDSVRLHVIPESQMRAVHAILIFYELLTSKFNIAHQFTFH